MTGFLLRKTFYNLRGSLPKIVLVNLGFTVIFFISVFFPGLFASGVILWGIRAMGILLCSIYLCAAAMSVKSISGYRSFDIDCFIKNLKEALPAGIVMGLLLFIIAALMLLALPFYMSIDSLFGLILAAVTFCIVVVVLLSLQFFFAIYARLDTKLHKVFKKCVIIFLENPVMSVFLLFCNTAALIISVPLIFLLPGPAGILLFLDEALRLCLIKYEWLQANPEADPRKIPWDRLLAEEREKTL